MRKFKQSLFIIAISLGLLALSCNQSGKKIEKNASLEDSISKAELKAGIEEVVYPLPTPFKLSQKLEDIGARYVGNILNPVENLDNYYTEKSKAIALGIYSADLSYSVTYGKNQESKVYSKAIKSIVDQLGIDVNKTKLLNEEDMEKYENKDTIVNTITNTFYDAYTSLNNNSEPSLAALMIAGIWVEGLFIATHISKDTYNNYEMVKIIYDQSYSLDKVIEILVKYEDSEVVSSISNALKKVQVIYKNAGDSLTKAQLEEITSAINTIRNSLIS